MDIVASDVAEKVNRHQSSHTSGHFDHQAHAARTQSVVEPGRDEEHEER